MLTSTIENSSSFGADQPFVTVGREEIDLRRRDIQWKYSQTLNCVQKKQCAMIMCHSSNLGGIQPVA